jgi:MHS family citrate/tricarballylate:H+ symporter-like MFS transporter
MTRALPVRKAMIIGIGNALEFYDFLTFSYFAIQIGHVFFPESQTSHGLLWSLATFGLGFTTRPLGGIVIGTYGDRVGRKPAMMLSFSLMGAAILGLALTPSYAQIGFAAPVLLLVFRLVQGFALGGEVGPSTAYLIEAAPENKRGFYVSIQYATQGIAILAAGLVGFGLSSVLSAESLERWGWRVAFLLGAAVVPVGLYIRRNLSETLHEASVSLTPVASLAPSASLAPDASVAADASVASVAPVEAVTQVTPVPRQRISPLLVVLALLMLGSNTIGTYVMNYMNTYAQDALKLPARLAFGATITMGSCYAIASLVGGWLSDRIGARRVMLTAVAGMFLLGVPAFVWLNDLRTAIALYTVTAVLTFLGTVACVGVMISIAATLPKASRSGGIAMLYAGAVALFGGTAQLIVKWLSDVTASPIAPAWYLSIALIIGGIAMFAFRTQATRAHFARQPA